MRLALTVPLATLALAGCGGSDSEQTVGGCTIAPGAQCSGADLTDAELQGADLSAADLSNADLTDANLSDADLSEANLSGAQIVDTELSGADLTRANLTGATITGTDLVGATLCGTTRTDGTIDDTSCPPSTDTTTTDEAEVTSFDVGDLTCDAGATSGSVSVSWETENATAVEIVLDTASPTGFPPSGSTDVFVPCDGAQHAITITPQGDAGRGTPEAEEVEAAS